MAGEVLNMCILALNLNRCKLKDLCFKNRHKTIYSPLPAMRENAVSIKLTARNKHEQWTKK